MIAGGSCRRIATQRHDNSSMAGFDASLAAVADAAALREPLGRFLCFVVFIVFFIIFLDHHVHAQSTHQFGFQVAFRARLRPLRGGLIRSNYVSGFNGFPKGLYEPIYEVVECDESIVIACSASGQQPKPRRLSVEIIRRFTVLL